MYYIKCISICCVATWIPIKIEIETDQLVGPARLWEDQVELAKTRPGPDGLKPYLAPALNTGSKPIGYQRIGWNLLI